MAGAPEITTEMLAAGEEAIDRAFSSAGLVPSFPIYAAVRDVYISMRRVADHQQLCSPYCHQDG
jgi:hypothetical protein